MGLLKNSVELPQTRNGGVEWIQRHVTPPGRVRVKDGSVGEKVYGGGNGLFPDKGTFSDLTGEFGSSTTFRTRKNSTLTYDGLSPRFRRCVKKPTDPDEKPSPSSLREEF